MGLCVCHYLRDDPSRLFDSTLCIYTAVVDPRTVTLHPRPVGPRAERYLLETLNGLSTRFETPVEDHLAFLGDAATHVRDIFHEFPKTPPLCRTNSLRPRRHPQRAPPGSPPVPRKVDGLLRTQTDAIAGLTREVEALTVVNRPIAELE